jgi:hypothetical protein
MFNNLQIVIPSRSRWNEQKTLYNLSEDLWPHVVIVCPIEQYFYYRVHHTKLGIQVLAFQGVGIGAKRQFILNLNPSGKLIMLDDDLKFYKRTDDGRRFPGAMRSDTIEMIWDIYKMLDTYVHVGLTDKFMSHTKPRGYIECHRFNQVLAFNRDLLPRPWPEFRLWNDEEHDVHLQLLTRGYKTAVLTEWSKSDKSNAPGGCSDWRGPNTLKEAHEKLVEYWPNIVSITPGNPSRARYNWKEAKKMGGI